ncbi:hypothetical protein GFJ94_02995 [Flavobacterium sp. LMO8]|uniref:hypothetical protein n=1 Tax=Flavobacterium sp. LMO8 TaxID=2654244 RepID=UPI0012924571|nr:hypothetical protein [Flavobacterium sp. LMO8]MQP24029.1 hypothetical protein [Flavobacterium sp. LMO8]
MKKTLLLFFVAFLFSCNQSDGLRQYYDDFEMNRWASSDVREFNFEIKSDKSYLIELQFSHVYDYQFAEVPLKIEIISPDGNSVEEVVLHIKDNSGKHLADCTGDYCDLFYKFKSREFKKGLYSIKITNMFSGPYLPNVLGVGVELKSFN